MSDYLGTQIINHIFRTSSFTKPTTLALALCTSAVAKTDTGATIPEVANSGSYARATLNPLDANWASLEESTYNLQAISFNTASSNWGTITYVAILDNATYGSGNLLFFGALTLPVTVSSGNSFTFDATMLSVDLDS